MWQAERADSLLWWGPRGEQGAMLGQSSHRGHQSSGWISCVWSVCSLQNVSAAPSHPFGARLSSDCSKQNADKPNWTGERSYIHFSFKHSASGKPQDIYNRGSRRQIRIGEANKVTGSLIQTLGRAQSLRRGSIGSEAESLSENQTLAVFLP